LSLQVGKGFNFFKEGLIPIKECYIREIVVDFITEKNGLPTKLKSG
jgi:hypothetical protein